MVEIRWILIGAAAGLLWGQSAGRAVFEVASVKAYEGPRDSHVKYGAQGVDIIDYPLGFMIGEAYTFPVGRIVPAAAEKDELLRALRTPYSMTGKAPGTVSRQELKLMLQSLLAERFQLKLHREMRRTLVYKLVEAKGGAKLQEADGGELVMSGDSEQIVFRNAEVHRVCGYLSSFGDRMVVDATGLTGLYNFTLKLPEDLRRPGGVKQAGASPDSPGSAVFAEALRPLGLQLVGANAEVKFLVLDRVGKLAEN
jgi:uncharacterized protein (TIGR03435 family)